MEAAEPELPAPLEPVETGNKPIGGLPDTISGFHLLKWIPWGIDSFVPIITQNENGPCPLLALCNVLLLQDMIQLPAGETIVTTQQLLELLGSCLVHCRPKGLDHSAMINYEQNMQDAIAIFPRLLTGLDVNVSFNSVDGFEFTQELSIFDLLGVHLYHGWLADPSDVPAHPVVSRFSYNQLVEFAISNLSATDSLKQCEALLAQQFLETTATQLTYHGLYQLNQSVKNGELCVFFRNNHFNTLLKRENKLMLLVTDYGFLNELGHVWHLLTDIDDSGDFLDANFMSVTEPIHVPPAPTVPLINETTPTTRTHAVATSNTDTPIEDNTDTGIDDISRLDRDLEVAMNLQAEETKNETVQLFQTDEDLALHLQEQELISQGMYSPSSPAAASYPAHSTPPTTTPLPNSREEYEAASQAQRRRRIWIGCCII